MSYYLGESTMLKRPAPGFCPMKRARRHPRTLGTPVPADMRQESGLDSASSLGFSFNVPGLTTSTFSPLTTTGGATPSTEPSLFDKAWQAWQNRPAALKAIKVKLKPQQMIAQLPPGTAARATSLMQQYGFQPQYQGMDITPGMAGFGQMFARMDWNVILIGAAVIGGALFLSKR